MQGKKVAGVDAEWEMDPAGRGKVARLQIAPLRGTFSLFHLRRGDWCVRRRRFPLPSKLFTVVADSNTIKVIDRRRH